MFQTPAQPAPLPRAVLEHVCPSGLAACWEDTHPAVSCFAGKRNTSLFTRAGSPCARTIQRNKNHRQNLGLLKHFSQELGGKFGLSYSEKSPGKSCSPAGDSHGQGVSRYTAHPGPTSRLFLHTLPLFQRFGVLPQLGCSARGHLQELPPNALVMLKQLFNCGGLVF